MSGWSSKASEAELIGVEVCRDCERGTLGGEKQRRERKSLRNGVHHANGVVWGPVYRTHLVRRQNDRPSRDRDGLAARRVFVLSANSNCTLASDFPFVSGSALRTYAPAATQTSATSANLRAGVRFKGVRGGV